MDSVTLKQILIEKGDDFVQLAQENLILILNSPSESLHQNNFIHDSGNGISAPLIIDFLVEIDHIETDTNDGNYNLAPDIYHIAESNELEHHLSSIINSYLDSTRNQDEQTPEKTYIHSKENDSSEYNEDYYLKSFLPNKSYSYLATAILIVFFSFLVIVYVFFRGIESHPTDRIKPKTLEQATKEYYLRMRDSI